MTRNSDIGQFAIVPLHIAERVSASALQVFVWLAGKWANSNTDEAYPGVELIAETLGLSTRTVRRALAELSEEDVIETVPRYRRDGGRSTNLIRIRFAQPVEDEVDHEATSDTDGSGAEDTSNPDTDVEGNRDMDVRGKNQTHLEPDPKETSKESLFPNDRVENKNAGQGTNKTKAAGVVLAHWAQAMHAKRRPKLTPDRRRKIVARLNEGYTVDDLIAAIDGCAASDFHMGRDHNNDVRNGGMMHNSISLILRNAENVDRFAAMAPRDRHPSVKSIIETRSVMTDDEKAEAVAQNEFPFDEASNEALARQEVEAA